MIITGYILVAIVSLGIIYVGLNYLFAPNKFDKLCRGITLPQ